MNLTRYNNEGFALSLDVTAVAAIYDLASAAWRLQARREAASPDLYLDIPTVGSVAYAADVVTFLAPLSAVERLVGDYAWDMGIVVAGQFKRLAGGTLTMVDGVTRGAV